MAGTRAKAVAGVLLALAVIGGTTGFFVYQFLTRNRDVVVVTTVPPKAPGDVSTVQRTGAGPSGTVRTADGKPVPQTDVSLATSRGVVQVYSQAGYGGPTVRTGADGRFSFPSVGDWGALVVRSSQGFAQMTAEEFAAAKGAVVVQAWGRIEGTLRAGTERLAGQTVSMDRARTPYYGVAFKRDAAPYRGAMFVYHSNSTKTDENGRFVFARVAPGEVEVRRQLAMAMPNFVGFSHSVYVDVAPGQTVVADIGGTGRPVTGKVEAPDADEPLAFRGNIGRATPPAPMPTPPNWQEMTAAEQRKFAEDWGKTPQGQAARAASSNYSFAVAPDGSFRADDIPAGEYSLYLSADEVVGTRMRRVEHLASVQTRFTVPQMPGGRSDEPLDVGKLVAKGNKRLKPGQTAPALEAALRGGGTFKLSDCQGKYVLIHTLSDPGHYELQNLNAVWDKFGRDERFTMLGLNIERGLSRLWASLATKDVPWKQAFVDPTDAGVPQHYTASPGGMLLIGPDGKLMARTYEARDAYSLLDCALGNESRAGGQIQVLAEHNDMVSANPQFKFKNLPSISKDDAAQQAVFTIVDGRKASFGGGLKTLNDGLGPGTNDDERLEVTFEPWNLEGRIKADLGRIIPIDQINTYSWYKNGNRYPHVYRVYGSEGSVPGFNADPKIGSDPAQCGWTLIASVDTRPSAGGTTLQNNVGGQDAVSIRGNAQAIGNYRYLLFLMFATETQDMWGQTFWSEIDVVERK